MSLKLIPVLSVLFLAACSSGTVTHKAVSKSTTSVPQEKANSLIVPVNAVASSTNVCVDNFTFLRDSGDPQYPKFSSNYIKITEGYNFLNVNKNIMGNDARRVYGMTLDMKMDTLCSEVNYASYRLIQRKIKELHNI